MTSLPLRIRITAWYFAVLAAGFSLFGVIAFYAMRGSIQETVDENLQDQIQGVRELIERTASRGRAKLAHELDEDEEIRAGSDLLQVSDPAGNWIYRSRTMTQYLLGGAERGQDFDYNAATEWRALAGAYASSPGGRRNLYCAARLPS